MEVIYISGKITGLVDLNRPKFTAAQQCIERLKPMAEVINPLNLPDDHDKKWQTYMRLCLINLCRSTHVVVLDDWKKSKGAIIEVFVAKILGILIYEAQTHFSPLKISTAKLLWLVIKAYWKC